MKKLNFSQGNQKMSLNYVHDLNFNFNMKHMKGVADLGLRFLKNCVNEIYIIYNTYVYSKIKKDKYTEH